MIFGKRREKEQKEHYELDRSIAVAYMCGNSAEDTADMLNTSVLHVKSVFNRIEHGGIKFPGLTIKSF